MDQRTVSTWLSEITRHCAGCVKTEKRNQGQKRPLIDRRSAPTRVNTIPLSIGAVKGKDQGWSRMMSTRNREVSYAAQ